MTFCTRVSPTQQMASVQLNILKSLECQSRRMLNWNCTKSERKMPKVSRKDHYRARGAQSAWNTSTNGSGPCSIVNALVGRRETRTGLARYPFTQTVSSRMHSFSVSIVTIACREWFLEMSSNLLLEFMTRISYARCFIIFSHCCPLSKTQSLRVTFFMFFNCV